MTYRRLLSLTQPHSDVRMHAYNSEFLKDRRVAARDKPVLFFSVKGAHEDRILAAE
jgi:aminoglycoside N3'-acetyltransferase